MATAAHLVYTMGKVIDRCMAGVLSMFINQNPTSVGAAVSRMVTCSTIHAVVLYKCSTIQVLLMTPAITSRMHPDMHPACAHVCGRPSKSSGGKARGCCL